MKLKDVAICVQAARIKDLVEASKRTADILDDQNVIMLFTAPNNRNMSEDFREYIHLHPKIELKKLRWKLAEEEEIERREAACTQIDGGETCNGVTMSGRSIDQAYQLVVSN